MWTTIILACLFFQPPEELKLHAESGGGGGPDYAFDSTLTRSVAGFRFSTITDTLTNYVTTKGFALVVKPDTSIVLEKAKKEGDKVTPTSITSVRMTYRPIVEFDSGVEGSAIGEKHDFAFSAVRWLEREAKVPVIAGAKLEAKFLVEKTIILRCTSEAADEREKSYRYTYTVENLGDQPIRVKWSDLEGQVKPKEKLARTVSAKERAVEESAVLRIEFANEKRPFTIRANRWALPK
jgi:hypothetical protein